MIQCFFFRVWLICYVQTAGTTDPNQIILLVCDSNQRCFFSVTVWAAQITSILILLLFFLYNADFGSLSYATVIQEFTLRHSLVWTESCSKSLLKDTLRGVVVQSILEFLKFWIKSVSVKPFTSQSYRSWLRLRLHTGLRTEIKTFLLQKRET